MGYTFIRKIVFVLATLLLSLKGVSQPYVDIVNTSAQSLQSNYKDALNSKNTTTDYFLNLTIPLVLDSQNTFIVRFYGENLQSTIKNDLYTQTYNLYSTLLPIGLQHETKNRKWKFMGLVMPKLSSDFKAKISSYDLQVGGYGLATYALNKKLKIKAGLFYNREFFGNFFVPLFSIDWDATDRLKLYGVLPTTYRIEYALVKQKLYAGLAFKSYTRSYRLSDANHDYVKNVELQTKAFLDVYIKKKFVLFAEFGRTIGYSPLAYLYQTKTEAQYIPIYTKIQDAFFFNVGLALRIRNDFK
ncbi:MAG TPA: DUF6268 family outer membrane beta-barrel protein [Bacteroidia bacterium]|jgi:hypothetical protein|nr:DUF6268 family outer membrane beta-barrel protein [Bacteroidia bacterium]